MIFFLKDQPPFYQSIVFKDQNQTLGMRTWNDSADLLTFAFAEASFPKSHNIDLIIYEYLTSFDCGRQVLRVKYTKRTRCIASTSLLSPHIDLLFTFCRDNESLMWHVYSWNQGTREMDDSQEQLLSQQIFQGKILWYNLSLLLADKGIGNRIL